MQRLNNFLIKNHCLSYIVAEKRSWILCSGQLQRGKFVPQSTFLTTEKYKDFFCSPFIFKYDKIKTSGLVQQYISDRNQ